MDTLSNRSGIALVVAQENIYSYLWYIHPTHSHAIPCRSLLRASMVLLPLLGLTWAFGVLALNEDLTIFAWMFTIFNSLQVLNVSDISVIQLIHYERSNTI